MKRFLKVIVGLAVVWMIALLVIGVVMKARLASRITTHLGEPLAATATVDGFDLALIRGRLDMEKLSIKKGDALAIDVADIRCDLPMLGAALVDGDCRTLAIHGMRVKVTAAEAFALRNVNRSPVHARHVVIDDAILEFSPSAFLPGLGRIAITVEHAEASDTVFKTPLSWIFALEALRAKLELPGGVTATLRYEHGKLALGGALFGSREVEVPFEIPVADLADDPRGELVKLGNLGKDLAERAVEQRAKDFLKNL